jgi:hypothetical protein
VVVLGRGCQAGSRKRERLVRHGGRASPRSRSSAAGRPRCWC